MTHLIFTVWRNHSLSLERLKTESSNFGMTLNTSPLHALVANTP